MQHNYGSMAGRNAKRQFTNCPKMTPPIKGQSPRFLSNIHICCSRLAKIICFCFGHPPSPNGWEQSTLHFVLWEFGRNMSKGRNGVSWECDLVYVEAGPVVRTSKKKMAASCANGRERGQDHDQDTGGT